MTGAGNNVLAEMERLEARRAQAVLSGDVPTLTEMLSDHLMYCHSTGVIDSKTVFIDKIVNRLSIFHDFKAQADAAIEPVSNTRILAGNLLVDVESTKPSIMSAADFCRSGAWKARTGSYRHFKVSAAELEMIILGDERGLVRSNQQVSMGCGRRSTADRSVKLLSSSPSQCPWWPAGG